MAYPTLYRKRLIPFECIELKDDIIAHFDDDIMFTNWTALHPKKDLHHGCSCYFFKEGFKVSQFLREDGSLLYWYCDIVEYDFNQTDNTLVITDLLADVIIYPDGYVKVVDLGELSQAHDQNLLTVDGIKKSLTQLNSLLELIYSNKFSELTTYFEKYKTL